MYLRLQRPYRHIYSLLVLVATLSLIAIPFRFPTIRALAQDQLQLVSDQPLNRSQLKMTEPRAAYGALPLSFELNQGQTDGQVKFLARTAGYLLFLTPTEVVMALENPAAQKKGKENQESRRSADESASRPQRKIQEERVFADDNEPRPPRSIVRMKLEGANPSPEIEGLEQLSTTTNYFAGSDPSGWRTDIPTFNRVRYSQVYPGIDMVYYGDQRRLEYDFVVTPGTEPNVIQIAFEGIKGYEVTYEGDLVLRTALGDIRQSKPVAYQEVNGVKQEVSAGYVPKGLGRVGFQLGDYDSTRPLIIDPVLVYSSYLGGSGFDQGYAIAADNLGNAYVTGRTAAIDFPTTPGAFQTNYGGGDAFVAKLNPAGTALVYSTYLNGASGNGIAVDPDGSAYVTGDAYTMNFPTTAGAFQTVPTGYDVFITKLNPAGSALTYSARFGGNLDDFGRGIAVDAAGNAYITGWTGCRSTPCTFPTVNAFQPEYAGGTNDAFVTKIDSNGSALVYSTYLGGGDIINATEDWGEAIAVDNAGSAYVTGYTFSPDFPITIGAFDSTRAGLDAFITKFTPGGASVEYSTFLGGPGRELGMGVAVDASGNAYVTGITESFDNPFTPIYDGFPVTPGAFQTRGSFDAFVTKLNPKGTGLVYSTYLGGTLGVDRAWAIALDDTGNAYITGDTTSANFPTVSPIQARYGGGLSDAFVTKLNALGSALVYSTFLGGGLTDEGRGIALGGNGAAFATGDTSSNDFPTANAVQPNNGGGLNNHDDAFVVKIGDGLTVAPTPTPTPTPGPGPTPTPTPTPAPALSLLTVNPVSVMGGASALGTVSLSAAAPTGGAIVTLSSSNGAIAFAPQSVTVAAGSRSASFDVQTNPLSSTTSVTISAAYMGVAKTALLTVNAIDSIAIQRADYSRSTNFLRVEATSTEPTALLRVYVTGSGALMGALSNNGGGSFSGYLSWPNKPKSITVRSNFGGSASKPVTVR